MGWRKEESRMSPLFLTRTPRQTDGGPLWERL